MKAVIQRVTYAKVTPGGQIGPGLLILLGIHKADTSDHIAPLLKKLLALRIFSDETGKMNLSLLDIKGELLIISQFTLYADTKAGRRPSFTDAAPPAQAKKLYEEFIEEAKKHILVQTGTFGAHMSVELVNDGPVTLVLENSTCNSKSYMQSSQLL